MITNVFPLRLVFKRQQQVWSYFLRCCCDFYTQFGNYLWQDQFTILWALGKKLVSFFPLHSARNPLCMVHTYINPSIFQLKAHDDSYNICLNQCHWLVWISHPKGYVPGLLLCKKKHRIKKKKELILKKFGHFCIRVSLWRHNCLLCRDNSSILAGSAGQLLCMRIPRLSA